MKKLNLTLNKKSFNDVTATITYASSTPSGKTNDWDTAGQTAIIRRAAIAGNNTKTLARVHDSTRHCLPKF